MAALARICRLFAGAEERVFVVSAYLGADALARLLDAIPEGVAERKVITRWDVDDIASGATDWQALDVAEDRGVQLYACANLHAKIYVADGNSLVGSANATAAGLGFGSMKNVPLLKIVWVDCAAPAWSCGSRAAPAGEANP